MISLLSNPSLAGVVELGHFEPTEEGTPQRGVISPLLVKCDGVKSLHEISRGQRLRVVTRACGLVTVLCEAYGRKK